MGRVTAHVSVSLDGFAAGPDQSLADPLGVGGEGLHEWMFAGAGGVDAEVAAEMLTGVGAHVMGRRMFGGAMADGRWDPDWRGWWGEEPPYHAPVFVLTHVPCEPLPMEGGTTFHFVTGGFDAALELARAAAGDLDVAIAGGASTVDQAMAAGALDELHLHHAPVLLGAGERLFVDIGDTRLSIVESRAGARATHVRYRVG